MPDEDCCFTIAAHYFSQMQANAIRPNSYDWNITRFKTQKNKAIGFRFYNF
jgi:hypothetical protein